LNKINFVILACILATLLFWITNLIGVNLDVWAFSTDNLLAGRLWTPVTALFVHADLLHLAGNMIFLYVFGNTLEKEVGSGKTFLAFFAGGILTFLFGIFFYSPSDLMIGASAAIFTLTAFVMLVKPLKFSFVFLMPVGLVAVIYFVYNVLAIQFGVESNVAYVSHVIGFGIGVIFGLLWGKNVLKNILITIGLFIVYLVITFLIIPYVLQLIGL